MIKKFPIDYMHQLCLRVTRKMILTWIRGSREVKLSAVQVEEISSRLAGLKAFVPSFFARRQRGMGEIVGGRQLSTGNSFCILVRQFSIVY